VKEFYVSAAGQKRNGTVTSYFVVASKELRTRRNGEMYLALILSDRTGLIEAKMWEHVDAFADCFEKHDYVKVRGQLTTYKGRYELVVERIRRAVDAEIEPADYLPGTENDINRLWTALVQYVSSIENLPLRALLQAIIADKEIAELLRVAPAAKVMHHAYLGGLLEHVVSLCGLSDLLCSHYDWLNRDLLITGSVLHDLGKIHELSYTRSFDYTNRGTLIGHIAIGLQILQQKLASIPELGGQLPVVVQHMILSHHGSKEQGSPVEPLFAEALAFSMLDNLDAKLSGVKSALQSNTSNSPWTARVLSLGEVILDLQKFLADVA
jgi:3'-5' exoribonuclease